MSEDGLPKNITIRVVPNETLTVKEQITWERSHYKKWRVTSPTTNRVVFALGTLLQNVTLHEKKEVFGVTEKRKQERKIVITDWTFLIVQSVDNKGKRYEVWISNPNFENPIKKLIGF